MTVMIVLASAIAPAARAADGLALGDHPSALAAPLRNFELAVWTTQQGLPQNSVRRIVQTADGYLWFSTWEGLVRYDGSHFQVYDRGNSPFILDNALCGLAVDRHGWLWAGDSRGNIAMRLPDGSWHHWPRPANAPSALIQALRGDGRGGVWVMYQGYGLGHFDAAGHFTLRYSATSRHAWVSEYLEVDDAGGLWVGGYHGAMRLDPSGSVSLGDEAYHLPTGFAWPYKSPGGAIWIVDGDGLFRFEHGRAVLQHSLAGMGRVTSLLEDRKGSLWAGTESNGVLRISDRGVEILAPSLIVPDGRVLSLAQDAEGSIWIGSNAGLARLHETAFGNFGTADGLASGFVRDLLEDHTGRIWIGSGAGLDRTETDGRIVPVSLPSSTGHSPEVLSLAEGADGTVWVGTYADGLYRIGTAGDIRVIGEANGLPPGSIRTIVIDPHGLLWVGTQRGVRRLDPVTLTATPVGGAVQDQVDSLAVDPDATWIGTVNGLWRVDSRGVRQIDLESSGGGRTILALTHLGRALWICTDRGLYRWLDGRLSHVGLEQGLGVDTIFAMVPDRLGKVWLTSNRGIWRVSRDELEAVADGRMSRLTVRHFDEADGMASAQTSGGASPSALLRQDGTLLVATSAGLTSVDPARVDESAALRPPRVLIDSVMVDARPVQVSAVAGEASVRLFSSQRLSISYVGLSSILADRITYRTRLKGVDDKWVERGRQRGIDMAGLMPGHYLLHVAAARPGGDWGVHEATLRIDVMPLWWQRLWVRLCAGLLMAAATGVVIFEAVRRPRRRALMLGHLVARRTAELERQRDQLAALADEKTALLEQVRLQSERLGRQALEDSLTGLPNRRAFDLRMAQWQAAADLGERTFSLVLLDLDHFKMVNDRFSHQAGDLVLREAAQLIEGELRGMAFAARTGGEEFAILLVGDEGAATAFCERLREAFHTHGCWGGVDGLSVTFSAGAARYPGSLAVGTFLRRADDALYEAKQLGRDRACRWAAPIRA
ncbi:diguanylate cyclase (GGDEF)-like protein [Endobacter medicaginis]|uniref:diguanylate cyclase n=2 Tax=Endobacter medicaginis TaxID=1181271 RepID=A0A850NM10_9PROT|nr:diguanylate cyclase (GGDEF)-like protein [Endobacter medicaginis]NVN28936.1 diguanylate cyclase [Endobacter medicaginis]